MSPQPHDLIPHEESLRQITRLPGDPLYEGGYSPQDPGSRGLPVSLAGRSFLVDLSRNIHGYRFSRQQVQLLNAQQQATEGDAVLTQPEVWRRYQDSWHQGAGQSRLDRSDSLPARFKDSQGIDPWTKYRITLLNDTTKALALPAGRAQMVTVDTDTVIVAVGTSGWTYRIGSAATPFALPAECVSITTDGVDAYALLVDGKVKRVTKAGVVSDFATLPAVVGTAMIRFAKSRLIAGVLNVLYEVTSGVAEEVYRHPIPGYRWRDATDGLQTAYVLGGMGDRWHVFRVGVDERTLKFTAPIVAAPIPEGEIGYALGSYLGYIVVGLNTGWRFGIPSSSGDLSYGRLIETSAPVECFEGQDRFVWYGQSSEQGPCGLGRADLTTFVAPNTPAYANDLRSTLSGRVGNAATLLTGPSSAGTRVFTVDGDGLYVESVTPVASGYLEFSAASFNTTDDKRGIYTQVAWETGEGQVKVEVAYDHSAFQQIANVSTDAGVSTGNLPIPEKFGILRAKVILEPAGPMRPAVTRWEARALPVYGKASEWRVPILLHEELDFDDRIVDSDPAGDYDFLVSLAESRQVFTYRERDRVWQVYATDFLWEPWRETRDGTTYQGLFVVTLKEMR